MKWCGVINLFPDFFEAFSSFGMVKRAIDKKKLALEIFNLREYSDNPQGYIDDRPFGGAPGMVFRPEPLHLAIQDAKAKAPGHARVIYLSPAGKPLKHDKVLELANTDAPLIFLAGRYEGIDQRIIDAEVDEQISLGDYVLSGGELAAMVVIDALVRWLPGVLGHQASAANDAFSVQNNGMLDCPHYTRPGEFNGKSVPKVLLSGDHQAIARWRKMQILGQTWQHRPDLLKNIQLDEEAEQLLADYKKEHA
jgi:tRNA (guanine37-N1)-methyltransferase